MWTSRPRPGRDQAISLFLLLAITAGLSRVLFTTAASGMVRRRAGARSSASRLGRLPGQGRGETFLLEDGDASLLPISGGIRISTVVAPLEPFISWREIKCLCGTTPRRTDCFGIAAIGPALVTCD